MRKAKSKSWSGLCLKEDCLTDNVATAVVLPKLSSIHQLYTGSVSHFQKFIKEIVILISYRAA